MSNVYNHNNFRVTEMTNNLVLDADCACIGSGWSVDNLQSSVPGTEAASL